jgi:hypothetical protein
VTYITLGLACGLCGERLAAATWATAQSSLFLCL